MRGLFNKYSGLPVRHTQTGLYGLALTVLIIIFLSLLFLKEEDSKRNSLTQATSYIEGLRIVQRINGDAIWSVTAKRADFTKDEKKAMMNSIVINMKKENMTLDAEKGVFDLETRDIKLEDNIVLKSKGYEVTLKDLSWNPSRGLLTSAQKIALKGGRFSIEGEGLSATGEQKLRLHRNVKAIFF